MKSSLSQVLSLVFHPLMMPTFTFILLYFTFPEIVKPMPFMALPFLFFTTFAIPVLSMLMLKRLGSIRSLTLASRDERVMPFFFITVFYGLTSYMFIFKIHVNGLVAIIFISTFLLLVVLNMITVWFKISIHAAALSGVTGYLTALVIGFPTGTLFYAMIAALLITGSVMSARLYLHAHTPKEIWAGACLGFLMCFSAVFFLA